MQLILMFTIPITPITKKNHQQIVKAGNRTIVIPSKQYREYEKVTANFIPATEISQRSQKEIDYILEEYSHYPFLW